MKILEEFYKHLRESEATERKLKSCQFNLNQFFDFYYKTILNKTDYVSDDIKLTDIHNITDEDFKKFCDYCMEDLNINFNTTKRKLSDMRLFWKFLNSNIDKNIKPTNFTISLGERKKRVEDENYDIINFEENYIKQEDIEKIYESIKHGRQPEKDKLYIDLILLAGLENEDVPNIKIENIDFENKIILTKNGFMKLDYFGDELMNDIKTYLDKRTNNDEFLFNISKKGYINSIQKIGNRADVYFLNAFKLRYTFRINIYKKYKDINILQEIAGLSHSANVKRRYSLDKFEE